MGLIITCGKIIALKFFKHTCQKVKHKTEDCKSETGLLGKYTCVATCANFYVLTLAFETVRETIDFRNLEDS